MVKICPDCGTEQEDSYKFCNNCGASLDEEAHKVEISEENTEETKVENTIEAEMAEKEEVDSEQTEETIETETETEQPEEAIETEQSEETIETETTEQEKIDEDIKRCANCGTILHDEKFCPNCGKSTETLPQAKTCPNCGTEVDKEKFCPKCGQKLDPQAQMSRKLAYCRNCGSQIDAEAEICPKCGVRQKNPPVENKNPLFALILSFIFPGLGQIYNGQNRKGILLIVSYIVSFVLWVILIGMILTLLVWLYGLYDAYTTAEHINNGEFTEDKLFGI